MKELTEAYVFAEIHNGEAIVAGKIKLSKTSGTFQYSDTWLNAENAYPLDPVNLPLMPKHFTCRSRSKVFGVFSDAGPDSWGTKVMMRGHTRLPQNELERLLACSGQGVGCITFSLSQSRCKTPPALPHIDQLDQLENISQQLAADEELPAPLLALIAPGSSMGGARPKVTITDGEHQWLAKFSLAQDPVNIPVLEYATMLLAKEAGIQTPDVKLHQIANKNVLLVKRFDIEEKKHFISARSLFNLDKIKVYASAAQDPYSYVQLARILRSHAKEAKQNCHELFKRICFNVLIGNIDDHAKNHALMFKLNSRTWCLTPAYDVLPILAAKPNQSLGFGKFGHQSSLENLRSMPEAYMLTAKEAENIIQEQSELLSNWRAHYSDCGLPKAQISLIEKVIKI